MGAIVTLALKDLRLLWRNKFGLFWVVAFPLMMALFFGAMFKGDSSDAGSLKIAAVRNEAPAAQSFFAELQKSSVLSIRTMSMDSARDLVSRGKLTAYVNYFASESGSSWFMAQSRDSIEVGIDPARKAESGYLEGLISQAYFKRLQSQMMDPKGWRSQVKQGLSGIDSANWLRSDQRGLLKGVFKELDTFLTTVDTGTSSSTTDTAAAKEQGGPFGNINLKFKKITRSDHFPKTSWEITFPQSLLWALLGCAATFALSLVIERTRGTYLRLRLAPITRLQILAGKGLACFVACLVVCSVLMAIGVFLFKVQVTSYPLLALAIACASFCFVGIMMLISVLGKTEQTVGGAGWAILLVLSMIGGGMIPLMFMPSWVAMVSNFSPMKWCSIAFEGAIWRGFGLAEMALPLSILVAVGLVGMIAGTMVMSRYDK
jgi:ABC-2 type transport system permease protein